jgi:hypothetical protein
MNKILKKQTPVKIHLKKKYTWLMDVYNLFKLNNINELLTTKENAIIIYIEKNMKIIQL